MKVRFFFLNRRENYLRFLLRSSPHEEEMKNVALLLTLLFIIQCKCQYSVTIDGQLSDWQSESGFSVGNNITWYCSGIIMVIIISVSYLGWWNGDINFALKTPNLTAQLKVLFYFNKQPFQTFSNGSDTGAYISVIIQLTTKGSSVGITTQYGTPTFPFNADSVAVWSYSDGLKLLEWNNTAWNLRANSTQTAYSTSIVEGKIISANSSLCTDSFTSVWIQFVNIYTNTTIGTLPGDYLAFT